MLTATRVRLYPNATQVQALARQFGCARWAWNNALAETQRLYRETGKGLGYEAMCARLPKLKGEFPWLADAVAQALQQALRNLSRAFVNFFERKARYPRFKSKHGPQSVQFPQGVSLGPKRMKLPKVGWIKAVLHRPIVGAIKTVTVTREACGHHYASILTEDGRETPPASADGPVLGVDVGLTDFAVTSAGSHFPNPRHLAKHERNLARKQRKLSRKRKGSRSRDKARRLVARVHERIKNARRDFCHKVSRRLVNENQVLAVEDLNVRGMVRSPTLAKAISDAAWGMLVRFCGYKAERDGKVLVKTGRFFPSSRACSCCGVVRAEMPLSVRVWTCEGCGTVHDRDENAATNIRDEAKRVIMAGLVPAISSGAGETVRGGVASRRRGRKASTAHAP
jgi:putative transposase